MHEQVSLTDRSQVTVFCWEAPGKGAAGSSEILTAQAQHWVGCVREGLLRPSTISQHER